MTTDPARTRPLASSRLAVLVIVLAATWGCGTVKMTGTARSATEQLLLTNAWDAALQKVDFRPLTGVPVYLDTTNVSAVDQGWVVSSLRQALLQQGVLLRAKPEQAQWIVEARVGAYGTDENNVLVGVPQLTIPPTVTGVPQGTIPKLPLMEKNEQKGVAKLALFAYDRSSGQLVWSSGTMLAMANTKDVTVLGLGPFQSGTIRGSSELMGIQLPMSAEGESSRSVRNSRRRPAAPFTTPALRPPTTTADQDAFAPD